MRSLSRRLRREWPVHLLLFLPNASVVFLLYYLVSNTLKPKAEFYASEIALPRAVSFDALASAVQNGGMLVALRNSIVLTSVSTLLAVFFGACAAYAFARLKLPMKYPVFVAILIPMSISPMIVTIPLFAKLAGYGLINTYAGGIIVYTGMQVSFAIYVLQGVFREIPNEVFEAARIDGAGPLRIFFEILLPMAAPGLVAAGLFVMLAIWNDLLVGLLFLSSPDVVPITTNVVTFQQKFSTDPQIIFAGLFLAALPMLLVYVVAQRFFVRGLGGTFR